MKKMFFIVSLAISFVLASCSVDSVNGAKELGASSGSVENYYGTDMVKLVWASTYSHTKYGMTSTNRNFKIRVKNVAFDKKVAVFHKQADGVWTEYYATYTEAADAGYEIWSLSLTSNLGYDFVVKYEVNGQTYWDNNNGANYRMENNEGAILGSGVNVMLWNSYVNDYQGNFVNGTIDIRNIAMNKTVEIVYSTDNWATVKTAKASYNGPYYYYGYSSSLSPNKYGIEKWNFSADLGTATEVKFAIKYTVNGVTYWDNNFGKNYTTKKIVY